jgi:hypothetical protein
MLPKKNMIVVAAFLIPVLCCLIGVGAFVLATTSISDPNEPATPQVSVEELRAESARLMEQIASLRAQIEQESERAALTQKISELIERLESGATGATRELSGLAEEIVAARALLQQVASSATSGEQPDVSQPAPGQDSALTAPAIPLLRTSSASGSQG